jgi:hypothetical protein
MQRTLEPWERFGAGLLQVQALLRRLGGVVPRDFAGLVIEDAEVDRLLTTLPGLDLPEEDETAEAEERVAPRLEELRLEFHDSLEGAATPFVTIARNARLTLDEAEVLAFLAATESEPARQRLLAYAQDHASATRPWLGTLDTVFPAPHLGVRALAPGARLVSTGLISVDADGAWAGRPVALHDRVSWALRSADTTDPALPPRAHIECPTEATGEGAMFTIVSGGDRASRLRVAYRSTAARRFLVTAPPEAKEAWQAIVREATVTGLGVVLDVDGALPPDAASWIERTPHLAWALISEHEIALEAMPQRPWSEYHVDDSRADADDWRAALDREPSAGHRLDREQLRLVSRAVEGLDGDLDAGIRRLASGHLDSLAVRIKPQRNWDDLVLPPHQAQQLDELVARFKHRGRVYDDWGFRPQPSAGIVALFSGQSGTGKTLAAEVIAFALGLDLYKVDLSTVVSKYIGETEKNLESIFTAAAAANLVLFFDEADAIFGKRSEVSDAHDRYANIEVAYLLQRLERYDGLVVLATNLQGNIDQAFLRRIHVAVDFPVPDEAERKRIWVHAFPKEAPRETVDFDFLAKQFKVTGGVIRNAALAAGFFAAEAQTSVTMDLVLRGVAREFEKMGRLRSEFAAYLGPSAGGSASGAPNGVANGTTNGAANGVVNGAGDAAPAR